MSMKFNPCARGSLLALFLLIFSISLNAQKTVVGKIVNQSNNNPVNAATIQVKGTNVATSSNSNGEFSIEVPQGKTTLIITNVGYENVEVSIAGKPTISVSMKESSLQLNEVLVTGYSSQRKKDITGAVSVVKVGDMIATPAGSAESQLQGRASGVTVTTSGQPGDGGTVRIRGFASLGGNDKPLYIIDGVPTGDLNDINSNDIESIQVLKDAGAASIYGSRASNGVLIITTKKGKQGAAKVTYDAYYGTVTRGKGLDILNPQGNADLAWLALKNSNQVDSFGNPNHAQYGKGTAPQLPDYIFAGGATGVFEGDPVANPALYNLDRDNVNGSYLIMRANKTGTNWYNEVFKPAHIQNHNLSVSGATEKSRFYIGANYFDQEGNILNTFYKRFTFRANSEFTIKNRIRIGENMQMSYSNNIKIGNQSENTVLGTFRIQPIVPVYDIAGNFAGQRGAGLGSAGNPVAEMMRAKDNRANDYKIIGNVYAEVDFLKSFTFRTSFGGQQNFSSYYWYTYKTYENAENNSTNDYNEGSSLFRSWTWTNQVSYKHTFNEVHNVSAFAGVEAVDEWGRGIFAKRLGYFVDDPNFRALNTGSGVQTNSGAPYSRRSLYSQFGKVDYAFKDKYYAGALIRRDGSSVFGESHRYGVFPAFTAGWRISRESFMNTVTWINDLKIRGGWGQMGSQLNVNPLNAFATFGGGLGDAYYDINGTSNSVVQGFRQFSVANKDAKWETNETSNIGFDATLFNNSLEITFDWYRKATKDLLYDVPLIVSTQGTATPPFVNIGSMKNTGVDIGITKRGNITRDFKYDAALTFTTYKNQITSIAPGYDYFESGGYRQGNFSRNQVGHSMSSFYGYKVIGFFQDAADVTKSPEQTDAAIGRYKYQDVDGDNKITDKDRTWIGNPNPKFTYGLNVNLVYRNFDLGMFFYGVQGREIVNYMGWWLDYYASFQSAKSVDALYNAWTPNNRNARLPIVENSSNFSNQAVFNSSLVENGSYLRLKNIALGYTLPKAKTGKIGIDKLRIYVQAANLLTVTKYRGLDPELATNGNGDRAFGIDFGNYPNRRQFLVGLNVNF